MHGMCKSKFYTNVRPKIKARREKRKQDLDRLRRQARAMEAWRRHCLLHENSKIME